MQSLDDCISRFAGYGNLAAPLWFVGMEEGGGKDIAELNRRVSTWASRGSQRLEDLAGYHIALGFLRHFTAPWPFQTTWARLCRIVAGWRGDDVTSDLLRLMQREQLGASNGPATLVELMPLPAPGTSHWPYADLASHRAELADRRTYTAALMPQRIAMLQSLLAEARPRAVVMYGRNYLDAWRKLSGSTLPEEQMIEGMPCHLGQTGSITFAAIPHPAARGPTNEFWYSLGRTLGERCSAP